MEDIKEDYEDVRQLHYETLRDRKYVTLEAARARKLKLDFTNKFTPGSFLLNEILACCIVLNVLKWF